MKKLILSLLALATMAFAFNSCSDVPEPYDQPSVSPDSIKGTGTADNPYTVAQAMDIIKNGTNTNDPVYVKGKVVQLDEFNSQYGNYTYHINDTETTVNALEIYRGKGLGNKNFTSDSDLKLGDDVVVCGVLTNYNGTYETASSPACYLYSLNGEKAPENPAADPAGTGTEADPFNVAAAIKAASALDANGKVEGVYVKGIISEVGEISTQFGNGTFYISDDGTTTNQFEIYRSYYLNGEKFTSADQIKKGDTVVVKGDLVNFRGNTLEMTQGGQIVSINGKGGSAAKGDGSEANPYSASQAYAQATTLDENGKIEGVYVTGTVSSIKEVSARFGNATYNISDDGTTSGSQFTIFRSKYLKGENFSSEDQIKVGDKVVVKGDIVNYKGNTPELAQGGELISISSNGGSTDTPTGNADVEITASSLGLSNATDIETQSTNGITITGNAGTNSNAPKFYTAGGGTIRMYPGNSLSISAGSRIASIVVECDSYNGTNYNAEGKMTASPGSVSLSDLVYTVTGINGQTVTITNGDSGSGAKTQLRIKTLKIYYAK